MAESSSSDRISIAASELPLIDALWREPGLAASEVHARVGEDRSLQTIKTLLPRLTDKGALRTEPQGRRHLYHPLISREAHAARSVRSLSDKLFGGRAAPIVAHLADGDGLSADDLAELEALVAALKAREASDD